MTKFDSLEIPHQWQHYWTKYPQGYTIIEALIDWVNQVNGMTDNVNTMEHILRRFYPEV
jgi:hypothetical protein